MAMKIFETNGVSLLFYSSASEVEYMGVGLLNESWWRMHVRLKRPRREITRSNISLNRSADHDRLLQ